VLTFGLMKRPILDTFVRISKATRSRLNAHCKARNLEQGRFADGAIRLAIDMDLKKAGPVTSRRSTAKA
jgi:hypothetical protein